MPMDVEEVASHVVDVAVKVHIQVGPGLLESVYGKLATHALEARGLLVERQVIVPFELEGKQFRRGLRLDMLVEKQVVVELKSTERVAPIHHQQLLTYLRLMDLRIGFLINFGRPTLKEGLRRVVNDYQPTKLSPLWINKNLS
jgi:iron complex transport system substrate-binding protein